MLSFALTVVFVSHCEGGRGFFIVDSLGTGIATQELPIFGNQTSVDLPLTAIHTRRLAGSGAGLPAPFA